MPSKTKKKLKVRKKHHDFADSSDHDRAIAKPKKKKLKYSNFYFTINTNLSNDALKKNSDGMITKKTFLKGTRKVFDNIERYIKVIVPGDTMEDVESVKVSTHPEIGKAKKLVHMHALVKIKHRTKIRIDYDKMKRALKRNNAVPEAGFHFYVKLVQNDVKNVLEYMKKTLRA